MNKILAQILASNYTRAALSANDVIKRFIDESPAQTREMEVTAIDVEARTVELSFSSEFPVQRWFGNEILDHSEGAVDWSRLGSGRAALLVDHAWEDQIGVIESARIAPDRIGRAVVRFGRSARAEEIFQDVIDKIRTSISFGYRPLEAKLAVERDDGPDDYLITRWMPYEISFVSVPADHTVGVGRAAPFSAIPHNDNADNPVNNGRHIDLPAAQIPKPGATNMKERKLFDPHGNFVRALVDDKGQIVDVLEVIRYANENDDPASPNHSNPQRSLPKATGDPEEMLKAERKRVADLSAMGELYTLTTEVSRAIADGTSVADFAAIALEAVAKRQAKHPGTKDGGQSRKSTPLAEMASPEINLSDEEIRSYSIFNVIRHLDRPNDAKLREAAAFEIECSAAAEKATGRSAQGLMIPQDILSRFGNDATMRAFNGNQGAANTPVGAQSGQNLIATNFYASSFIEMLRDRAVIMQLARTMGGLVGNVEIPKQIGASQAFWIGEHENAQETTPVIGQIGLNPHTLGAYTDITRRLLMQSTPDAEGIVRADLINAMAQEINRAAFYGTGLNNQPTGLVNQDGINAAPLAGTYMTYDEAVDMESEIAADNADVRSMAYVMDARARGAAKKQPKFTAGASVSDAGVLWESGGTINGYRTEVTNSVESGDVFFGNFNDFIIGMWGGLDMIVDPYSLSIKGGLRIVTFQDVDFALRRTESFVYGTKAP